MKNILDYELVYTKTYSRKIQFTQIHWKQCGTYARTDVAPQVYTLKVEEHLKQAMLREAADR